MSKPNQNTHPEPPAAQHLVNFQGDKIVIYTGGLRNRSFTFLKYLGIFFVILFIHVSDWQFALTDEKAPQHIEKKTTTTTVGAIGELRMQQQRRAVNLSLCYVHVGKAGGGTIVGGLTQIHHMGRIGDWIHVHSMTPNEIFQRWIKSRRLCQSPRPLPTVSGCESNWVHPYYPDVPEYCESCHACSNTGFVLLWVRDPVSRLVSTWNFSWNHRYFKTEIAKSKYNISLEESNIPIDYNNPAGQRYQGAEQRFPHVFDGKNHTEIVDLNTAIETIADWKPREKAVEMGLKFFVDVPHAINSLAYYLGGKGAKRTFPDTTCVEVVKTLNIGFVGRT